MTTLQIPPVREPIAPRHHTAGGLISLFAVNWFQLFGAILVAVLLPALLRSRLAFLQTSLDSATVTTIGTAVAVAGGAYLLRRLTVYPGAQTLPYVVPVFAVAFATIVIVLFFIRGDYSRAQWLMSFILVVAWYFFVLRIERRVRRPRFLIFPFGNAEALADVAGAGWQVAQEPDDSYQGFSGVVTDLRADLPEAWERKLAQAALHGVPVFHSKQLRESLTGRVDIEHISENQLGSLLPSRLYVRFKRLTDVLITVLTLPIVLPVIAIGAVALRVVDGGPVLFRQQRVGFRGRTFTVLKLRTMRSSPEIDGGQQYTEDNDTRVTPLGRHLRRWRIDELPQIANIIRGDMSWIGPRPEALSLARWYESKIPFYSYRHIVRPGITGWAAVNQGNVARIDAATTKLQYDFYYVKHFSPWLDILILAKTVRTVVTGFGAK